MLKALGLGAVFAATSGAALFGIGRPAAASDLAPSPLLTGSVRDQTGAAPPARVRVRDVTGRVVGSAETARDGTFAIVLDGTAATVEVSCVHCAPFRAPVVEGPLVAVVTRFHALDGGMPDGADLAALPYRDPAQAVALNPFTVALQGPGDASPRFPIVGWKMVTP